MDWQLVEFQLMSNAQGASTWLVSCRYIVSLLLFFFFCFFCFFFVIVVVFCLFVFFCCCCWFFRLFFFLFFFVFWVFFTLCKTCPAHFWRRNFWRHIPADTWRLYNVATTSMQHDVASTLRRRCINVVCLLGCYMLIIKISKDQFVCTLSAHSVYWRRIFNLSMKNLLRSICHNQIMPVINQLSVQFLVCLLFLLVSLVGYGLWLWLFLDILYTCTILSVWFWLNVAFNNLSVILRRCLTVAGSSMLKYHAPDTLTWYSTQSRYTGTVLASSRSTFLMLSAKQKSS